MAAREKAMRATVLPSWECTEAAATKMAAKTKRAMVIELGIFIERKIEGRARVGGEGVLRRKVNQGENRSRFCQFANL